MILEIIGMIIGAMIFGAGIYYLIKESKDKDSRIIYGVTTSIGAVILIVMLVLIFTQ